MTIADSLARAPRASSRGRSPRDPELDRPFDSLARAPRASSRGRRPRDPGLLRLVLILGVPFLVAAAPKPKTSPTAAPTNACASCKERRPTLDPQRFARGFEPEVSQGYAIARQYPATLDKIHCFCECAESPMYRHKTLLTCFTDLHAAGCGICLSEARLAAQLKERGLSDVEIKNTVESVHRTDGHPPT